MGAQGLFGQLLGGLGGGDLGQEAQELLSRFQGGNVPDQEAQQQYAQVQDHPDAQAAQQEVLNSMPPDDFSATAEQAAQSLPPQQRQDVASSLLGALQGRGLDLGSIASMLGLGSANPGSMGPADLARLLGWAQQNQPDALHEAIGDKPWFVQALGSPVVSSILSNLAGRLLNR